MALLIWMIKATWQNRHSQGQALMLQALFMVALMLIGHFGGLLGQDAVSFVWISLFLTHMIGMTTRGGREDVLPTMLILHQIPLIVWVWVHVLVTGMLRGVVMTGLAMLVLAAQGPVTWTLAGVLALSVIPLMLYRLLVETLMESGGLSFVWLCPLLTPLMIFGLDTLQRAAAGTLTFSGGAVYGMMYLLFCVAVLPWIVAWIMKERLTS
ncbi:MAG: hypothetical protein ACKO43_05285 [Alphaproteobacteria bacterium]